MPCSSPSRAPLCAPELHGGDSGARAFITVWTSCLALTLAPNSTTRRLMRLMLPALGMLPAPKELLRPGALACVAFAASAWGAAYALAGCHSLWVWGRGAGNWGLHLHSLAVAFCGCGALTLDLPTSLRRPSYIDHTMQHGKAVDGQFLVQVFGQGHQQ